MKTKIIILFFALSLWIMADCYAEQAKDKMPIEVTGEKMEYSSDQKEVTATGDVVVIYKDSQLTCDKITVNVQTKDCVAEGHVRLVDRSGIIQAGTIMYNFDSRTGSLLEARMTSEPFYGRSDVIKRVSEKEFKVERGYVTTCNFDHPHYRLSSKSVDVRPGERIAAKGVTMYAGKIPVFYFPGYVHNFSHDKFPHVEIEPGQTKDWGGYLLTAWRFNVSDNVKGKLFVDFRQRLGRAEGLGLNYKNEDFGKGDFKYYYTDEHPKSFKGSNPSSFQRYMVRWRHTWDIDDENKALLQFYNIGDEKRHVDSSANFLKDYFYREFERDEQPKTYFLFNHIFPNSSLNFLTQKRTTGFFSSIEKLPELSYDAPALKLGETPFYFNDETTFSNLYNRIRDATDFNAEAVRFDTINKVFMPAKLSFVNISPFVGLRETYYNRDRFTGRNEFRSAFITGVDLSTKFFRTYDVNTNAFKLNIHGLRHIINPSIKYNYIHDPTIARSKLYQFDSTDELERTSKFTFELTNKLQTKHEDEKGNKYGADIGLLRVFTDYNVKRQAIQGRGFSDLLVDLELTPFSWMSIYSDARYGIKENTFKTANADFSFTFAKDRTFSLGPRYAKNNSKELATQLVWRINPKWKFRIYERYQFAQAQGIGFSEQEYSVVRDMHCWELGLTYNIKKNGGSSFFFVFTLKAFPNFDFDYNKAYYPPRTATVTADKEQE